MLVLSGVQLASKEVSMKLCCFLLYFVPTRSTKVPGRQSKVFTKSSLFCGMVFFYAFQLPSNSRSFCVSPHLHAVPGAMPPPRSVENVRLWEMPLIQDITDPGMQNDPEKLLSSTQS